MTLFQNCYPLQNWIRTFSSEKESSQSFQEQKRRKNNLHWANYFLESFCYCCYLAPNSDTYRQLLWEENPGKRRKGQRMKLFTNLQKFKSGVGESHSARLWGWACKVKQQSSSVLWAESVCCWFFPILLLNIGSSKSFF